MTRAEPSPTSADLAGELRTVVNRLGFHLRSPATRHGITPTRLTALVALAKTGPQRPGDLAGRLQISAASMSRVVDALTAGGWVTRRRDPEDQRAQLLSISVQGIATLDELRQEGTTALCAGIADLTSEQRAALAAALPVLTELADHSLDRGAPVKPG